MSEHFVGLRVALVLMLMISDGVKTKETECSMTNPCAHSFGQGKDFKEPVQVGSKSTSWSTTLTLDIGEITYDWLTLKRRMYNGFPSGPTICVKRGDHFNLDLVNKLGPEGNHLSGSINIAHHPNSTNIHTHGLHISSQSPQDNVLISVGPRSTFQYKYHINPNNAPGTNWYHAHLHGSTAFQVEGGLAGILIIEDKEDEMPAELAAASCPNNCDKDIQLLFQQILHYVSFDGFGNWQARIHDYEGFRSDMFRVPSGKTLTEWLAENVNYFTTNGLILPTLSMRTGQMHRFRMVNGGGNNYLDMYITDLKGRPTSACDIREIALDGIYLPKPRPMHDGQSLLVPGGRVDWLVKCNVPGTYKLTSFYDEANENSIGSSGHYSGDLVTLVVSGDDAASSFPSTLPGEKVNHLTDLRGVAEEDIGGRFVVEFGPNFFINREAWSGPDRCRYKMKLGELQEWQLMNVDSALAHPFHIHVNHFQVISYNKYEGPIGYSGSSGWFRFHNITRPCYYQNNEIMPGTASTGVSTASAEEQVEHYLGHEKRYAEDAGGTLGYARLGEWRDTINLPPLSNITIRFRPSDYTGNVIIHCHKLEHEDAGMMMLVQVVNPGESLDADIASGDAYPGTCRKCDRYPPNNASNLCQVTNG